MRNGRLRDIGLRAVAMAFIASAGLMLVTASAPVETGCADKAPPPKASDPIVIGASLGLTNGLAGISGALRDALKTAEGQINASGGLLGRPVVFDIQDDASDEGDVVTAKANEFVRKGVVAVIGPVSSGQVVKVQQIYHDAHIIQLLPTATSVTLTTIQPPDDRWLFRTTPADDFQGAAVMLFAQRTPLGLGDGGAPPQTDGGPFTTCTKLAIVHVDNAYGNAMGQVIQDHWKARVGIDPILSAKVAVDLSGDYKQVVSDIYTAPGGPPQCVAFIMYEDVGAEFIREFKADPRFATLPNGFFFIGTDGVYDDTFLKDGRANLADETGPNVLDKNVFGTAPDTQPGTPEYNQYRTILSSYFPLGDNDAPPFSSNGYDAAMLIALAIAKANTIDDHVAVRNALLDVANPPGKSFSPGQYLDALQAIQQGLDIDYKGASGNVDVDPQGNVKSGFAVWQAIRTPQNKVGFQTLAHFDLVDLNAQLK